MVNFHDPAVVFLDFSAFLKLCHILDGLYIWEFVTTLDYEWRVIQGRVPYRWTIWIYSLTRLATLMTVIINIVNLSLTTRTNCQVWITFNFIFSYSTFAFSSLVIILRILAIWNKNKVVVGLTTIVWGVNISFLIQGISRVRSAWNPVSFCSISNAKSNTATFISMFITDFVLLVIMLFGLLRLRSRGAGTFALGRLLWKQGVTWLLLSTAAELPPAVFICLDLNEVFDVIFLMPALIIMSIAVTRMHRSLSDFCSAEVVDSVNPPRLRRAVPNAKSIFTVPTPSRRATREIHTAHEKYPSSLTKENALYMGRDCPRQLQHDKQVGLIYEDVESSV